MLWQGLTHLEAHVVRQAGEEVVLHVAADERVAEAPIKQCIAGQVEHTQTHLLNALGLPISRKHGEADVLEYVDVDVGVGQERAGEQHAEQGRPRRLEARDMAQQAVMAAQPQGHEADSAESSPHLHVPQQV